METTTIDLPPPSAPPAQLNPKIMGNPRRYQIAADVVARATADLPPGQAEALRWLDEYGRTSQKSASELGALLEKSDGDTYSGDSVYQVLTGRRKESGANIDRFVDAVDKLRRRVQETASKTSTRFVETQLTRMIHGAMRSAFDRKRVCFIFGESQIGKTTAAGEYARLHNHGETKFFRMPTGGAVFGLVNDMAGSLGINRANQTVAMRRIFDCFDERNLLIVDECHQAILPRGGVTRSIDFLREIHDRRGCGLVLIGTNVFRDSLRTNKVLAQIWRRRSPGMVVQLPDVPAERDMDKFARAFGLDPAPDRKVTVKYSAIDYASGDSVEQTFSANPHDLQSELLRSSGLGSWVKLLEDARHMAAADGKPLTWGRVLVAYCLAQASEQYSA